MTRAPGELLRDVAKALACFASTKHAQAHVQKNPAIKAEMLLEVAYIEALEREVRDAAQAQADTAEGVLAAVKAANRRGGREPVDVPSEEYEARLDVIDTGRAYASALMQLDRLHEQRAAFHAAQARLDAALAQAQAGAGSEGQGEGA